MEKKKCVLKFKQETTENGNVVRVANIAGTLKRLSEKVFDYTNAEGTVISYKLATIQFNDLAGTTFTEQNVKVYEASYEQGMEEGETYLGRIQRSKNADGSSRKPWVTLYSAVVCTEMSDDDFEDAEISVSDELTVE
jgi:hypothetical protein